jgi:hypothetical protein
MKLLASAAAILCVAMAAVAAPALSGARWRPQPLDFELAPPAGAQAAGGDVVSRPLRAPRRFNLVGLRWRGRAEPRVAVRVRRSGRRWSRWLALDSHAEHGPDPSRGERTVGASAPLWAGDADQVQYRLSRRVPGLRLHFVNVKGTATAADRARTALRRAANGAAVAVAGVLGARDAQAQDPQPAIVRRADWGAAGCPPRSGPSYGSVKAAHIHHTVSANAYTRQEAPGIVLGICRYHRNSNGWSDIGYNFLVDKYGVIYEGRAGGIDRAVVGAQAQGFNSQTTGISNIGNHSSVPQTREALAAMARLIRWKLPLHGAPTIGRTTLISAGGGSSRYPAGARVSVDRVLGHRTTNSTACPGSALFAQLPQLRSMVAGASPASGAPTFITSAMAMSGALYREPVPVGGFLSSLAGNPLPGETVHIQVRRRGLGWVTTQRLVTAPDGAFATILRPRATRRIRAHFPGRVEHQPSSSASTVLRVRPRFSLRPPPPRGVRGRLVPIRGRVSPAKPRLYLVLQVRRGGTFRRLALRLVPVRRGRFRTSFTPPGAGVYRFYLVAKADRATVRARTEPRVVAVGP